MNLNIDPITTVLVILILVYSAILHEIMHGYIADRLGDPTARLMGRLTLNPLPHIDLYYTILLPLMLYLSSLHFIMGGAKPVPVDPFNLKERRKDMALVSLAGPLTNIVLAIIASLFLHIFFPHMEVPTSFAATILYKFFDIAIRINLFLAIFNLIPIPPLDGSKVFTLILPDELANSYLSIGQFGLFILIFLFFFPIGPFSLGNIIAPIFTSLASLLGIQP